MMRERSIRELLRVMLKHQYCFRSSLCHWINVMMLRDLITLSEWSRLSCYIKNNKPLIKKIFPNRERGYYWKQGEIKPRIKWINKHIKKLS